MNFLGTPLPYFQNHPIFKIIDRVTNLLYSLLKLATAMLKWFQTLDKDQKATIVSSAIIICLTVFASFFLPVKKLLLIFPLQFLITYFLFCTTNIKRLDHWYIDQNSNKQWLVSCSSTFPGITIILITLFAVIAVANPSKFFCIALPTAYNPHSNFPPQIAFDCPIRRFTAQKNFIHKFCG